MKRDSHTNQSINRLTAASQPINHQSIKQSSKQRSINLSLWIPTEKFRSTSSFSHLMGLFLIAFAPQILRGIETGCLLLQHLACTSVLVSLHGLLHDILDACRRGLGLLPGARRFRFPNAAFVVHGGLWVAHNARREFIIPRLLGLSGLLLRRHDGGCCKAKIKTIKTGITKCIRFPESLPSFGWNSNKKIRWSWGKEVG